MADAIASISDNEQITAVVEKTDNDAPTFNATVNTEKGKSTLESTLVISDVKDKDNVSSFDNIQFVVKDKYNDKKSFELTKTTIDNKDAYSCELNGSKIVTVTAIDEANNSSDAITVGKVLTVVQDDNVYKNGAGSCTFKVTVDKNGLDLAKYEYRLVLYKKDGKIYDVRNPICPKEIKKGTNEGTNEYDLTVTSDGEYRIQLEPKWVTWAILAPTEAVSGFKVEFDDEAPTISADNLDEFINSLTIGVVDEKTSNETPEDYQIVVNDKGDSGVDAVYCKIYYTKEPTGTGEDAAPETTYVVGGEEKIKADGTKDDGFGKFINEANEATFTVVDFDFKEHEELKGKDLKIEVYAVDKAGNRSETKTYTATVDTTPPEINCEVSCANGCDNANDDYYHNVARTATITVSDDHLSYGTVTIVKDGDTENPIEVSFSINKEGTLTIDDLKRNDIKVEDGVLNVAESEKQINIEFSGDGEYEITEIKVVDLAGNEASKTKDLGGEFEIDTIKPTIGDVEFGCAKDENENPCSNTKNGFHSAARTATITVSDKNLSGGTVTIVKDGDTENPITVKINEKGELSGILTKDKDGKPSLSASENGISVENKKITFNDNAKYQITKIVVSDFAGNTAEADEKTTDEYNEKVLGGKFVIDTTNPDVKVSYTESKGAENGKYYNVIRTATISVTEANFEKEIHVVKNFDGDECKKPGVYVVINLGKGDAENVIKNPIFNVEKSIENAEWTDEGEEHTITVTYDANKAYTFDIKVVDQALRSNQLATDISTDKDFVIDKDIVAPVISGVSEGAAYPDECVPTITFTDANYASGEVKIYQTRDGQINRDVTSKFGTGINTNGANGTGGVSVINTIAKVPENDGIYTIVATMTDKAGNRSESRVTFSVNRFGSVYKLGDEIANLRDSYVRSVKNDLVLTEINPDMLIAGSAKVSITRNGKPIDVIFDVAPNPDKNAAAIGSSGWYEYIYTISAKNFEKDGAYVITVSSTDEAGNNSSTTSYEECSMEFKVDSTKPEFTSLVGLEKAIINAESAPVTFGVHDAIGISNITLYCDGKVIASFESKDITDVNNFEGKFVVPEGSNQVVRIVVVDLAGNVTDTEKLIAADELPEFMENIQDITVSTNFFVRWFANKLVFFGSIIGVIAVGAAAWWFLFGKKRSKSETNS